MLRVTTIKDVAKKLNIHPSTVSRALNNHPDVKPETKNRVRSAAKELHYEPNSIAQSLKSEQTNLIGVIVPEIKHYFFSSLISGIEKVASRAGYVILVCQSDESYEREVENTNALIQNRVAGLIVSISQNTKDGSHFEKFHHRGGAIVFCDRVLKDSFCSTVTVDDFGGAFKATEYLISKGYRKIAHLAGSPDLILSTKRFEGYKAALKKNKLEYDERLVTFNGFHESDGRKGLRELVNRNLPFDAIFTVNDPNAVGVYEEARKLNIKIPDDLAVMGFSNNPISIHLAPALTTMEQPSQDMGKEAAEILISQIRSNRNNFDPVHKVIDTKLIIRDSS